MHVRQDRIGHESKRPQSTILCAAHTDPGNAHSARRSAASLRRPCDRSCAALRAPRILPCALCARLGKVSAAAPAEAYESARVSMGRIEAKGAGPRVRAQGVFDPQGSNAPLRTSRRRKGGTEWLVVVSSSSVSRHKGAVLPLMLGSSYCDGVRSAICARQQDSEYGCAHEAAGSRCGVASSLPAWQESWRWSHNGRGKSQGE